MNMTGGEMQCLLWSDLVIGIPHQKAVCGLRCHHTEYVEWKFIYTMSRRMVAYEAACSDRGAAREAMCLPVDVSIELTRATKAVDVVIAVPPRTGTALESHAAVSTLLSSRRRD